MSISKKVRFEVFKRDGFTCGYCGKTPPGITLEIDHIQPKSDGGNDDINNLLSACFDCNRGKRNYKLSNAPNQLAVNLEILKEKEEQLKEYNKVIQKIEKRAQREILKIEKAFQEYFTNRVFTESFKESTVKRFVEKLPVSVVEGAMRIACGRKAITESDQAADDTIRYFCGICWKKIKGVHYR